MTYLQYRRMIVLWELGANTYEIAERIKLSEADVAERISMYVRFKHKKAKVAA